MNEKDNHLLTVELSEEQNGNMLDGILNNLPPSPLPKGPEKKELEDPMAARIIDAFEHPITQISATVRDGAVQLYTL